MMDDATTVVRRAQPLSAPVDGEMVMFDPTKGAYFALGAVGSRVWQLLERPVEVAAICATLEREYAVDPATCRDDVTIFLTQLQEADLIEVRR
jgi:Coenzyme PQQ synthesis protein D (PqqD)